MTDYTRYPVAIDEVSERIAMWCNDCYGGPYGADIPMIWQDSDEQVTELCLANLIAVADEHEAAHRAEASVHAGDKVAAAMNKLHPDPNGGRWSAVVLGGGPR